MAKNSDQFVFKGTRANQPMLSRHGYNPRSILLLHLPKQQRRLAVALRRIARPRTPASQFEVSKFIRRILNARSWMEQELQRDFFLALRLLGTIPPEAASSRLRRGLVRTLFNRTLGDPLCSKEEQMISQFRGLAGSTLKVEIAEEFQRRLQAEVAETRIDTLMLLEKVGSAFDTPVVRSCLSQLVNDDNPTVSGWAVNVCIAFGPPSLSDCVLDRLLHWAGEESHCLVAATKLANLPDKVLMTPKIWNRLQALSEDRRPEIRKGTLEALGRLASHHRMARRRVLELMEDGDEETRDFAAQVYVRNCAPTNRVADLLFKMLHSLEPTSRSGVHEAFLLAGGRLPVSGPHRHALLELTYNPVHWIRTVVLRSIRFLGPKASTTALVQRLLAMSEVKEDAEEALAALGALRYRSREAIERLEMAAANVDPEYGSMAGWALVDMAEVMPAEVTKVFLGLANREDAQSRQTAAWGLGKVRIPRKYRLQVQPTLLRLAQDPASRVRYWAAISLGELRLHRESSVAAQLLRSTSDLEPEVRAQMVWALRDLQDPGLCLILRRKARQRLVDPSPEVRFAAAEILTDRRESLTASDLRRVGRAWQTFTKRNVAGFSFPPHRLHIHPRAEAYAQLPKIAECLDKSLACLLSNRRKSVPRTFSDVAKQTY